MADQEDLVDTQMVEKEREIRSVADPSGACVLVSGQTSPVEARPVDPVEPRFTGEDEARERQQLGVGFRPDLGSRRSDLSIDLAGFLATSEPRVQQKMEGYFCLHVLKFVLTNFNIKLMWSLT